MLKKIILSFCFISSCFANTNIQKSHLQNIEIYSKKTTSIPAIDIAWLFPRYYAKNSCVSDLFSMLSGKKIASLGEEQTLNSLNDLGSEYNINFEDDYVILSMRTLVAEKFKSIEWFKKAIFESKFDENIFKREKNRLIQTVLENQTQPNYIALKNMYKNIYQNHPYATACSLEDAKSITLKDINEFYKNQFGVDLKYTKLIAVGDTDYLDLNPLHQKTNNIKPYVINPPSENSQKQISQNLGVSQAHVNIGSLFIKRDNKDIFDILVANYILGGGGFNSRLMQDIREKQGFVYGISSTFLPLKQQGLFYIDFQTKVEQVDQVKTSVKKALDEFIEKGITQAELDDAKKYLIQSFSSRLDTNKKWLNQLAILAWYDLPIDYLDTWQKNVEKTDINSVNTAIKKYFDVSKLHSSIVN